jgi:uncharacterized membrane protein
MSRTHLALIVALVVADAAMSIVMSRMLPARVPGHWNIHGEVDRYGDSSELTVFFPFFIAAQAALMVGIATVKPVGRASRWPSYRRSWRCSP